MSIHCGISSRTVDRLTSRTRRQRLGIGRMRCWVRLSRGHPTQYADGCLSGNCIDLIHGSVRGIQSLSGKGALAGSSIIRLLYTASVLTVLSLSTPITSFLYSYPTTHYNASTLSNPCLESRRHHAPNTHILRLVRSDS